MTPQEIREIAAKSDPKECDLLRALADVVEISKSIYEDNVLYAASSVRLRAALRRLEEIKP